MKIVQSVIKVLNLEQSSTIPCLMNKDRNTRDLDRFAVAILKSMVALKKNNKTIS